MLNTFVVFPLQWQREAVSEPIPNIVPAVTLLSSIAQISFRWIIFFSQDLKATIYLFSSEIVYVTYSWIQQKRYRRLHFLPFLTVGFYHVQRGWLHEQDAWWCARYHFCRETSDIDILGNHENARFWKQMKTCTHEYVNCWLTNYKFVKKFCIWQLGL